MRAERRHGDGGRADASGLLLLLLAPTVRSRRSHRPVAGAEKTCPPRVGAKRNRSSPRLERAITVRPREGACGYPLVPVRSTVWLARWVAVRTSSSCPTLCSCAIVSGSG